MIKNAFFIFGICALLFVYFLPSYLQMQEMHEKNVSYERQIREIGRENEVLLEEKRRLEEDPAYFERFAREKFGIIKDGETIYKIVPLGTPGMASQVNAEAAPKADASPKSTVKAASPKPAASSKPKSSSTTSTKKATSSKATTSSKTSTTTKKKSSTASVKPASSPKPKVSPSPSPKSK